MNYDIINETDRNYMKQQHKIRYANTQPKNEC